MNFVSRLGGLKGALRSGEVFNFISMLFDRSFCEINSLKLAVLDLNCAPIRHQNAESSVN